MVQKCTKICALQSPEEPEHLILNEKQKLMDNMNSTDAKKTINITYYKFGCNEFIQKTLSKTNLLVAFNFAFNL